MDKQDPLLDKSLVFAARIVKLYQYLVKEKKESIISKQIREMLIFRRVLLFIPASELKLTVYKKI